MTKANLKLEGLERLEGEAEVGGDYVRLLIDAPKDTTEFPTAARGEIDIDGTVSDVALENVSPASDGNGVVLTMRLFKPMG